MDDTVSFNVPDSVIASDFDGKEVVLLDTSTQRYYTLNETAAFLWAEIDQGRTVAEMTARLCATFEVGQAQARASVIAAVTHLESQMLIVTKTPGSSTP